MSLADRMILEYQDIAAGYLRASGWVYKPASIATLTAALQAATRANLLYATRGDATVGVVSPATGTYELVMDMAVFNFQTSGAGRVQLSVPAPDAAMFGANGATVDPTNPLAAAIIAAVIGTLSDVSAQPVTAFINGSKVSRRRDQE